MTVPPSTTQPAAAEPTDERRGLVKLAILSLVAGASSGLVGACFRQLLAAGDALRNDLIAWAHGYSVVGLIVVVSLAAAATATAAWLVRRFSPEASGSGIPHVEAVLHGKATPAHYVLIPVKFVGGILAIGAGLALGREGPTVQMGASVSHAVSRLFRLSADDGRILLAAGAGAGLATAFNAPIAGSVFVLEELLRRFDTRITIITLGASAAAIGVSRFLLGVQPDFPIAELDFPALGSLGLFIVFGAMVGALGIAYNRAILVALDAADRLRVVPVELRAAVVGAAVGMLGWFAPQWVGGGDNITELALEGKIALGILPALFALRFVLGAVSYAAGTPGGLFAPLLVLGAQAGLFYGTLAARWLPQLAGEPASFAVTGMAAFFTATVRAPVTGIILVIELTASDTQLVAMLAGCFTAMFVPTLAGSRPIYDSLGERA
ncbi:MAG: H(+)/Cl(-) exchange transporter ClcA [Pirellulales bacterium]